ncbi:MULTISPECIES: TcmI family type II polyketide cyclase [unclassified Frankia]|uniref:TcmI family type II polyketide cyclase n=1 Tax=unclassified Frankia TaxID=2632575 RepID=UPI0020241A42
MHRSLIVAKITPGAEKDVARIFAESDATGLPRIAGVTHRSLYSLGDLYVHLLETTGDGRRAVDNARGHEEFARVSERLSHYIQPYLPTWRSPEDAIARRFYTYEPGSAGVAHEAGSAGEAA